MHINATLLGQMLTFSVFVWFTMRFVWPPLTEQLSARREKITQGLAAAELGEKKLEDAREQAAEHLKKIQAKGQSLLQEASAEANQIVERAKADAIQERSRILAAGLLQLEQATASSKQALRAEVAELIVLGAEKILRRDIKAEDHQDMLLQLSKKL